MTLDPIDLSTFLVVVRERSFGRAASALLVSQPTVSERIARLERSVGSTLFIRAPRGVRLTGSGTRLVSYAERIWSLIDEAVVSVRSAERLPPLRVGVHSTFSYRALPLVLEAVRELVPQVRVRDAHSDEIIAMLTDGVLDVGFVLPGARPPTLRFTALPPDPVMCVCSPSHALSKRQSVKMATLSEHPLALNLWGTGAESFADRLAFPGASTPVYIECSDAFTALRLAKTHGYLALVASSAAEEDLVGGRLKILHLRPRLRWVVNLVLATRPTGDGDPRVESIRDAVRRLAVTSKDDTDRR